MSRLPPPDPATLTARQKDICDTITSGPRGGVRGPLAIWLHRPELADKAQALGRYCRYDTSLPPYLSELAILVTARVWTSEYEWQAHKKFALEAGLSPAIIEAIRKGEAPSFDDDTAGAVHDFALSLQRDRHVSQSLYDRAVSLLGEAGVIDLTGILGYYALISMTINVFEVDPPNPNIRELTRDDLSPEERPQ